MSEDLKRWRQKTEESEENPLTRSLGASDLKGKGEEKEEEEEEEEDKEEEEEKRKRNRKRKRRIMSFGIHIE